jgi:2-amino-4-hydroxy-6-hydroxymethyldihydropteridine diphosphokinase
MIRAYIALGSNLGNPRAQLISAVAAVERLPATVLAACSPAYASAAVGPGEQPDYLNAVIAVDTALPPGELLAALQAIEADHGRCRAQRWAARTLDLDLLVYGEQQIQSEHLDIPHPRLAQRNFVLYPLSDIAPELTLPCGTWIGSLLVACPRADLQSAGELRDPGA